jgi:hypothetical protein
MAAYLATPRPLPESCVDETGRLKPESEEEHRARVEALAGAIEEMKSITDETDTEEAWREFARSLDESRPHRPLFREYY